MSNKFYDLREVSIVTLRKLMKGAIGLSYSSNIQKLEKFRRENYTGDDYTLKNIVSKLLTTRTHNVFILRKAHGMEENDYYEVGFSTLKNPNIFLYCFLTVKNGEELIHKFNLKQIFNNV